MRTWAVTFTLLATGACTIASMPVKPELAAGAMQPFERDVFGGSHVRFGPFRVDKVDRSWSEAGDSYTTGWFPEWLKGVSTEEQHEDYQFALAEEGQGAPRTIRCRAGMTSSQTHYAAGISSSSTDQRLYCGLWGTSAAQQAQLQVRDGKGQVQFAGRTLRIEGRDILGHATTDDPAGYAVVDGERDVAAVQVVNAGAAWMNRDLDADARSVVAMSTAALLLYHPPRPAR